MNNRQTFFGKNDWIRPNTTKTFAQYSSNAPSSFNVRPPYRSTEKFSNEHVTKSDKPISSTYNSRVYEPPAIQASCAPVNFTTNQSTIYSPRLTHQASLSSQQVTQNFQVPQNMHGIRHETPTMRADFPTSNQFAKIPCNISSVQSSESHNNTYSSIPSASNNVSSCLSTNQNNIAVQYSDYRNPPYDQNKMISILPNSSNNSFIRQTSPVPNMSEFARLPPPPSSNPSNFIRQPLLAYDIPDFKRPRFPHGFNKSDTPSSNDNIRQPPLPGSSNPDFIKQPPLSVSNNLNFMRQPPQSGSNNLDFIRQPPLSSSSNLDFVRQPPPHGSSNMPDSITQLPPSGFSNPDCIRQPFPSNFMAQQPPNFPTSNIGSSSNLPYSMQIPPPLSSGITLNQDSQFNMLCGPNLSVPPPSVNQGWMEENKLNKFMEKFTLNKRSTIKADLTIINFRNKLKEAFATVKRLVELKENLLNLVDANESDWNEKLKEALHYQDKLSKECDFLSKSKTLKLIQERLKSRKLKRELKKKIKLDRIKEKTKKIADREELHHTIDKWLESIKEKNLKLKREAELKKEADSILSEVRRKIHEAKRTIEKIKVFEKLRSARQANAIKKGLSLPDHDEKFQIKISELKSTLYKQLSDYESEEKALKVMLEAEQEGQLEEEALWRIKKLKNSQQRRQKNIKETLFGNEEEPSEENSMFLFHQFHSSGNKSIENLVQIRHHWDLHLSEDGEVVPLQWVVPVPPSNASWEVALEK